VGDNRTERRFSTLCQIVRAQHFAWREAVRDLCPSVDPADLVARMWQVTGRQTARAYLKRVDPSAPLAPQIANAIVWSSESMGEDAVVEIPETEPSRTDEAFVRHRDCPWFHWHRRLNLLDEDRPGCDTWFQTVVEDVNRELGTKLRVETLETLPEGGSCCLRRFWVED
jgi:hypothetical protein